MGSVWGAQLTPSTSFTCGSLNDEPITASATGEWGADNNVDFLSSDSCADDVGALNGALGQPLAPTFWPLGGESIVELARPEFLLPPYQQFSLLTNHTSRAVIARRSPDPTSPPQILLVDTDHVALG